MTLLSAWALAGLVLSVPLVLVHLRRRRPPLEQVDSLLTWQDVASLAPPVRRRLGRPLLPLLLALQLGALVMVVVGLARPAAGAVSVGASRVYVIDDSIWMQAREPGAGNRLAAARALVDSHLRRLPAGTQVRIVLAGASPELWFSGPARGALRSLARLPLTYDRSNLAGALRLAGGLAGRGRQQILLVRAPEDTMPPLQATTTRLREAVVGRDTADQGLVGADARCGLPAASSCEVFARVTNSGTAAVRELVSAVIAGNVVSSQAVTVAPRSSSPVAFHAPRGSALELRLPAKDDLAADDRAFISVPALGPTLVTLVGRPTDARPLAAALAATPGVRLRLRTPADYRAGDASSSDLLVLDGFLPRGQLPRAPALMLIDPPRLPGGAVRGRLTDSRVSGADTADPLLEGVDLLSLTIDSGQARRLATAAWMRAVLWSPEGPLLAVGDHDGQRVAALAFDPAASDLPQLEAFPRLISNLVADSQQWAPLQLDAGEAALVQTPPGSTAQTLTRAGGRSVTLASTAGAHPLHLRQPGFRELRATGPWGTRRLTIAVNADIAPAPAAEPVTIGPAPGPAHNPGSALWPWALSLGLILLVAELLFVTFSTRARVALG